MIYGIALVKDEADIIEQTVRHMASQVDALLVADNLSTDGTRDLLSDLARDLPLTVIDDVEVAHYQARKLTALAFTAGDMGGTWAVPFDADEIHYGHEGRIADILNFDRHAWIYTSTLCDHIPTVLDSDEPDPIARLGWRYAKPLILLKVACRIRGGLEICEGSHSCNYHGTYPKTVGGKLAIRHYPNRSPEQFVKKARNGAKGRGATTLSEDVGRHFREYGAILEAEGEEALHTLYRERFLHESPDTDPELTFDPWK